MEPELKSVDTRSNPFVISSDSPFIALLNGTNLGFQSYQRTGKVVSLNSVHLKILLRRDFNTPTNVDDATRMMLIYDNSPNGVLPTLAEIIKSEDSTGATTVDILSHRNLSNTNRFTCLFETTMMLPSTGVTQASLGTAPRELYIERFVNLKGELQTIYNGNVGGISDITTGSLVLVVFGDRASAQQPKYTCQYSARVRYFDD